MKIVSIRYNLHEMLKPVSKKKNSNCRLLTVLRRVLNLQQPASLAEFDARLTGHQEVAGLTPAGSATFFRGD